MELETLEALEMAISWTFHRTLGCSSGSVERQQFRQPVVGAAVAPICLADVVSKREDIHLA